MIAAVLQALRRMLHLFGQLFRPLRRRGRVALRLQLLDAGCGQPPVDSRELELVHRLAHCDGCGLCDAACVLGGKLPFGVAGPTHVVLLASRSQPPFAGTRAALDPYRCCGSCRACEPWCPQQIPIGLVPAWAAASLARLLPATPAGGRGSSEKI